MIPAWGRGVNEMHDDLGTHRATALEAVNAAFEAGRIQGIAEERSRVKALLDADFTSVAPPKRASSDASRSYGNVITVVRPALREIGESVDARGLAELIGGGITEKQTRNALQQLVRVGDALRTERGRYLWRQASESAGAERTRALTRPSPST
jgi:hypothetical protein